MRGSGSYSRMVAWLKLLLPLVALGLLSTIFLFARNSDPTADLPIATQRDLAGRQSQMVTEPSYAGVTDSGAMLTVRAGSARPDPETENRVVADRLDAAMEFPDGSRIDLAAPGGALDQDGGTLRLEGGVQIRSSQGYTLETDALVSEMERVAVESDGKVRGKGPAGTLEAGRLRIEESPGAGDEEDGAVRMLFTDGVDMIYQP